ncbi:hypothetical protein [Heyndrickxia oleronia]|uniref:hypothetical protein n=1 Tax=Heyndrickxia oleronia TaxID=38875 RepID=UPI0003A135BA|nr:hypothetical protein [Heyndrickxia oleronia]MCI1762766.1 hypothetical protein [Heyndrickxia oleronia]
MKGFYLKHCCYLSKVLTINYRLKTATSIISLRKEQQFPKESLNPLLGVKV